MADRAAKQEYEKAAELRDVVFALEETLRKTRRFERHDHTRPASSDDTLRELQHELHLASPPRAIECFDISHISGTFVVASMVRFTDGRPDKDNYRRFQIKSFIGNDDFRAMEEVVGRRYRRLAEEQKPFPDLVVIDGGRGQIGAALKAFVGLDAMPPPLIGLAKEHETIIFPDERAPLNLPLTHPGLQLLQRLRDEAHRFAIGAHRAKRSAEALKNPLDEIEGVGPGRKRALLHAFGSARGVSRASVDDLLKVDGVSQPLAERIYGFFRR